MPSALKTPPDPDALRAVAARTGTPTYAYVESIVRRQCDRLRTLVDGIPTRLLYAMKANASPALLRIIHDEGLGLDVVSPGEMELALRMGFAPDELLFSSTGMSAAEMEHAVQRGVLPNIGTLSRLDAFGQQQPGAAVCVRLNPMIGTGHHEHVVTAGSASKFGIPVDQMDAVMRRIDRHQLNLVGLHQHVGSGVHNLSAYRKALDVLLRVAGDIDGLSFINVGGGLNTPQRPDDGDLEVEAFRAQIIQPLQRFVASYPTDLTIRFEPGRFLVAEAGVLLTQVHAVKQVGDRTIAITDTGMNHLIRPPLYDAYHAVYNLSNPDGALQPCDVVGNICESGDVIAKERPVQSITEGDLLAVLDTGAYGIAMASTYNLRPLPAEVVLHPDGTADCVRPRQSPEAMAASVLEVAESTEAFRS